MERNAGDRDHPTGYCIMKNKSAVEYYRGKEKYNCAQAITKAFQSEFGISDKTIKSYKRKGKGKAQGGVCGSVFAARQVLRHPAHINRFERLFIEKAGALKCKEIRKLNKVDCEGTVALSEDILHKLLASDALE